MSTSSVSSAIAFVSSDITDYSNLIAGLPAGMEVHVLDAGADGLAQMSEILSAHTGLQAIHVFSHGSAGAIRLGTSDLTAVLEETQKSMLQKIGAALVDTGDLLFYACNAAATPDSGAALLSSIASQTRADVALSSDVTGNMPGANWALEVRSGEIDTTSLSSSSFNGILGNNPVTLRPLDSSSSALMTSGTVDAAGNTYITGQLIGKVDFDPSAATVILDETAAASSAAIFVAKYSATGDLVWAKMMDGATSAPSAYGHYGADIAVDSAGAVYTVGTFFGTVDFDPGAGTANLVGNSANTDGFIVKLDASGNYQWAKQVAGTRSEEATEIAIDTADNIYIGGSHYGVSSTIGSSTLAGGSAKNLYIAKLNTSGDVIWTHGAAGSVGDPSIGDLAVDGNGNVFATGSYFGLNFDPGVTNTSLSAAGYNDGFLWKLTSSGAHSFAQSFGGSSSDGDGGSGLAIDNANNVYLTGSYNGTTTVGYGSSSYTAAAKDESFLAKLTNDGNHVWVKRWNGAWFNEPAIDSSGNLYLPGQFGGAVDFDPNGTAVTTSATTFDGFVLKLGNNGTYQWVKSLGSDENGSYGQHVATLGNGNLVVFASPTGTADVDPGAGANNVSNPFFAVWSSDGAALAGTNVAPLISGLNGDVITFVPGVPKQDNDWIDSQYGASQPAKFTDSDFTGAGRYLVIQQTTSNPKGNFFLWTDKFASDAAMSQGAMAAGASVYHYANSATPIGTVDSVKDGQGGRDLVINFSANVTESIVDELLGSLMFNAPDAGQYTFELKVWDGTVFSNTSTFTARSPASVTGVSATNANARYKMGDLIIIEVSFDGNVEVVPAGDGKKPLLTLETGSIDRQAEYVSGSGSAKLTFAYTVQAGDTSADLDFASTAALNLNGAEIKDPATGYAATITLPSPGSAGSLGANKNLVIDGLAPTDMSLSGGSVATSATPNTVVGTLSSTDATASDSFTYTLVSGAGDTNNSAFSISGSNLLAVNPASLTPGANSVRVRTTDAAGNVFEEALSINVTTNPTVTIGSTKTAVKAGETTVITFTFSEAPTGFADDDITVTGATGSLGPVTVDGSDAKLYRATFTPTTDTQSVLASISVAAGKFTSASNQPNVASNTLAITGDTAVPTVASIARLTPAASVTNADSLVYRVTFSEAVQHLDAGDFTLTGPSGSTLSVTPVDSKTYDVTVAGGNLASFNGNVTLAFAASQNIADMASNTLTATTPTGMSQPAYTLDNTVAAPAAALATDTGNGTDGITGNGTVNVTLASDVASWEYSTNNGGTWTAGSGTSFTLAPATYAAGQVQVRQTDLAGNLSTAGNLGAVTVDTSVPAPGIALGSDTGSNTGDGISSNGTVNVTLASDVASWQYRINDGSWTTGQGTSFTLDAGTYDANSVKVRQTDTAGNVSVETANAGILVIDTGSPTVTGITRPALTQPAGSSSFTIDVAYADSGAGLDASTLGVTDITITGPGAVGALSVSGVTYNAATKTATYTVSAPAGGWNAATHAGSYTVGIAGSEVRDLAGNSVAANAAAHSFNVSYNANPAITSNGGGTTGTINLAERKTAVTTVTAADGDQDAVTYSISGGADQAKFSINSTTGALTFLAGPSFATPTDSDGNNSYLVEVTASDGKGGTGVQALTVNVLADLDGDGTEDAADDDMDNDGRLNSAEDPVPGANGVAGDGNGDGIADSKQINVASLPTAVGGNPFATLEVANGLTLTQVSASVAPGGLPRNVKLPVGQFDFTIGNVTPGATVEMSIYVDATLKVNGYFKQDNTGKWASIAKSVTTVGTKTKITFELTDGGIYDSDGQINGSITDPGGAALIAPLISSNGGATTATISVAEMSKAVTTVSATAPAAVTYSISGGADAALFSINTQTGALSFVDAPDYETPKDVGDTAGNNSYMVNVTATADGETDTQIVTVKVTDVDETPPATPPKTATVDGVTVGTGTVTNSDGSTSQVVTIPVVVPTRTEEVGNNKVADIPLVKATDGSSVLGAQVPTGIGLTVTGSAAPKTAGTSVTDLIREIKAHTEAGSHDQTALTGGGSGFLADLPTNAPLLVQTIVPTAATGSTAPTEPLVIAGTPRSTGTPMTALVIDARGLPSGSQLQLQNVEFAAVIGAVKVTGGAGSQNVWGDGASQFIMLGADDDILHGGAGDDTVGSAGGNDQIFGDEGNDLVFGGEGNDAIDGGTGIDTVRLVGTGRADYTMRVENGKLTVTHRNGGIDGTDTVASVEKLNFTGIDADMTARGIITRMYDAMFDRAPDPQGLEHWIKMNGVGMSMHDIASQFVGSSESQALLGSQNNVQFVDALYQRALGREADAEGRTYWLGLLEQGKAERADVMYAFANSAEKLAQEKAIGYTLDFNRTDVATLVRMYDTLFDRKADTAGLNHWIAASENGMAIRDIAWNFIQSDEALAAFGGMSNKQFVEHLYQAGLERQGSSAEVAAWEWQLDSGAINRADALLGFADSAEKIELVGVMSTSIETL